MIEHCGARPSSPLTPAIRVGNWVYVSGQASTDRATGEFLPGTFEEEFERSMSNLVHTLRDAGADLRDVVKVTAYVRDEVHLPLYNSLYLDAFSHPRPARTTVKMGFEFLQFEMEAVAYLKARTSGKVAR